MYILKNQRKIIIYHTVLSFSFININFIAQQLYLKNHNILLPNKAEIYKTVT